MKDELRLRFRALRDAHAPSARKAASESIRRRLTETADYQEAKVLVAYAPMGSEVDVEPLLQVAGEVGKTTGLPRMLGRDLSLHRWRPGDPLELNRVGIREPVASAPPLDPTSLDLVIVPGLAFDRRGGRLGYGGGFYDRLLRRAPRAARVAVAFDFQIVPHLPSHHLDVPVDCVVTETRILEMPKRKH